MEITTQLFYAVVRKQRFRRHKAFSNARLIFPKRLTLSSGKLSRFAVLYKRTPFLRKKAISRYSSLVGASGF